MYADKSLTFKKYWIGCTGQIRSGKSFIHSSEWQNTLETIYTDNPTSFFNSTSKKI